MPDVASRLRFALAVLALVSVVAPPPAAAWLYNPKRPNEQVVRRVAFDPAGGLVVAIGGDPSVRIAKLNSLLGGEVWSRSLGSGYIPAVDIAVNAKLEDSFRVAKLSGATGAIIWETPATNLSGDVYGGQVAFDANG